jgi:DNA polymerase-3 subunit alpha
VYIPLRVHSHYSLLHSALRIEDAVARAKEWGLPALALTDDGNLFGAVEFSREAEAAGLKPILGCDLFVARGSRLDVPDPQKDPPPWRMVVLCENETGYQSLVRLVSEGYLHGLHHGVPRVDAEVLTRHATGLIAISPGRDGEVGALLASGRDAEALAAATRWRQAYGASSFALGLQDDGEDGAAELNRRLADLAARAGIRCVACSDVRFLDPDDLEAYRALHGIGAGRTLDDPASAVGTPKNAFRSPDDVARDLAAYPDALAATAEIAGRCRFSLAGTAEPRLPDFVVPEEHTLETFLRATAEQGLKERRAEWARLPPGSRPAIPDADYDARLELELDVICRMGFPGYFLIVWDLFRFAREGGIPVGPGRGSSAGSLVAYCLRITDMDPLQWGLLFERFLNPGRKSLPDIDMDFCQRRRGELIRYVQQKYGSDHVCQIITFGALNAKSVIRDVGRVLNMTYGEVDRIARLIPNELKMTLAKALQETPQLADLRQGDPRIRRLLDLAESLEGLARNAGVHAAGVIIAPRPLVEIAPLYRTGRDEITTQYDMGGAEAVGLVKMDFLGLKTLTVLDDAL